MTVFIRKCMNTLNLESGTRAQNDMRASRWPEDEASISLCSYEDLLMRREARTRGKMVGREGLEPSTK